MLTTSRRERWNPNLQHVRSRWAGKVKERCMSVRMSEVRGVEKAV